MIDLVGYDDVPAVFPGEFAKLPAGGYVCLVTNVEITNSKAGNPMIVLFLDIAEGEFAKHFRNAFDRVHSSRPDIKWDNSGIYRQLIFDKTGKVSRFFKGLLTCFERSNGKFYFNPRTFDEQALRGCLIGFIFAEEEYQKKDSTIGVRTFAKFPRAVDDIRSGNFNLPELKKLDKKKTTDIITHKGDDILWQTWALPVTALPSVGTYRRATAKSAKLTTALTLRAMSLQ